MQIITIYRGQEVIRHLYNNKLKMTDKIFNDDNHIYIIIFLKIIQLN